MFRNCFSDNQAAPSPIVLTATAIQPKCFGELGSVTLSATGGVAPYTYGGAGLTNLTAGTYSYTVSDSKGCAGSTTVLIQAAPAQLVLTATPTQPNCFGQTGSVALSASGGTPTYVYGGSPLTGLSAGTYSYTVTDANLVDRTTKLQRL